MVVVVVVVCRNLAGPSSPMVELVGPHTHLVGEKNYRCFTPHKNKSIENASFSHPCLSASEQSTFPSLPLSQ